MLWWCANGTHHRESKDKRAKLDDGDIFFRAKVTPICGPKGTAQVVTDARRLTLKVAVVYTSRE